METTIAGTTYRVERIDRPDAIHPATASYYHLHGPRGAFYGLMRNMHNPDMLFVVGRRGGKTTLKGITWFTDRNGTIEPAY